MPRRYSWLFVQKVETATRLVIVSKITRLRFNSTRGAECGVGRAVTF